MWSTDEIVEILIVAYKDALTDLETATVLDVAQRFGLKPRLRDELEALGWEVEL